MRKLLLLLLLAWPMTSTAAFELVTQRVADGVYALVGEIGPRSAHNHALNNTLGFIVTGNGVIVVGSGASPAGAALIEQAVARVSDQPVRWVINIGVQDHHWLGNDHFAKKGAQVIALQKTVSDQQQQVAEHLSRLKQVLPVEIAGISPSYADKPIAADAQQITLGGIEMDLAWSGGGHFPGDAYLWMPQQRVLFAGDIVFHDRMLGIQDETPILNLLQAFGRIAELQPEVVIPGHGYPGDMARARRDTGDYLDWLVTEINKALDDWEEIGETVNRLAEAPAFRHLQFYDGWHRTNINRVYLKLEATR